MGDISAFEDNFACLQVDIVTLDHRQVCFNMTTDIVDGYSYLPCD